MASQLLRDALVAVRGALVPDVARGLYHEALKRLDDSNDAVRLTACGALAALSGAPAAPAADCWRGTPVEYTIDTLLLHLDDPSQAVQVRRGVRGGALFEGRGQHPHALLPPHSVSPPPQEAVYGALMPWATLAPAYAQKSASAAMGKHRSPDLCQKLMHELQVSGRGTS